MNLFFLHLNPIIAATYQCDKHVVKMLLETAQILSTVCRFYYNIQDSLLYKPTHTKHPVVIWTSKSRNNFEWVLVHGFALCDEYTKRYNKIHKSEKIISKISEMYYNNQILFESIEMTIPKPCMPDECKIHGDIVASYRKFYNEKKELFAKWKYTDTPYWFISCKNDFDTVVK